VRERERGREWKEGIVSFCFVLFENENEKEKEK